MSDLPTGWAESTLEAVVEILDSKRVPVNRKERDKRQGDVPYFGATGQVGTIDDHLFDETLVLLGEDGAPFLDRAKAKAYIVRGKSWVNNHAHALRALDAATTPEFLMHQLNVLDYGDHVNGTTRLKLTQKSMREIPLAIPPLPEQQRIVAAIEEHFSRLDAAEGALEIALRRLDTLRQATTSELFSPDEWGWTTLGEIADVRGGVTKDSKRQDDPEFVEVPFLRVANVQRGFLDLAVVKSIRVAEGKAKALALEPGDILFNEGGDRDKLGRGWVWDGQIDGCIHQNHVFRARLLADDFDPRFVSTHGNTWGKRWFEENGRQTTNLASLNLSTLKQFPVPAAPKAEQLRVVERLRRLDDTIGRAEQEVTQAQRQSAALRRTVLAAAFSGQLVPQDPSDEPASALLERIAAEQATAKPTRPKKAVTADG